MREGLDETRASIAEATRSAKAMEDIAGSMATSVQSVKDSIVISREIADTQKLVTVIQHRAHVHVTEWKVFRVIDEFPDTFANDRACMIRFFIKNRGASKAWVKGMNALVPSIGYARSPAIDIYLDPDDWVEQRISFTLPDNSAAETAFLGSPLVVNLNVFYSDGFANRTKNFSRATFSHADALTAGDKPTEQWWFVHGRTAMNGETEEEKDSA